MQPCKKRLPVSPVPQEFYEDLHGTDFSLKTLQMLLTSLEQDVLSTHEYSYVSSCTPLGTMISMIHDPSFYTDLGPPKKPVDKDERYLGMHRPIMAALRQELKRQMIKHQETTTAVIDVPALGKLRCSRSATKQRAPPRYRATRRHQVSAEILPEGKL